MALAVLYSNMDRMPYEIMLQFSQSLSLKDVNTLRVANRRLSLIPTAKPLKPTEYYKHVEAAQQKLYFPDRVCLQINHGNINSDVFRYLFNNHCFQEMLRVLTIDIDSVCYFSTSTHIPITPLELYAVNTQNYEIISSIVQLLMCAPNSNSSKLFNASSEDYKLLHLLLNNPHQTIANPKDVINVAIKSSNTDALRVILNSPAFFNPDCKDSYGVFPIHLAARSGSNEIMVMVAGVLDIAALRRVGNHGKEAVQIALDSGNIQAFETICERLHGLGVFI